VRRRFDDVVIVDWSSASVPTGARPRKDAIWIGHDGVHGPTEPTYHPTRADALARLRALLGELLGRGRRVLAGFDFPFGYPAGVAERLTGRAEALALWDWLAEALTDGPDNANDRFAVAARMNRAWPGVGPLWGRPESVEAPDVPLRKSERVGAGHPADWRRVEHAARAGGAQPKSCMQLAYSGAVGAQVIVGLPALRALRAAFAGHAAVWPFETGLTAGDAPLVLAEIYPSLLREAVAAQRAEDEILDRAQVRVTAAAYAALDASGGLSPLFAPMLAPSDAAIVAGEEAWILGVGCEPALRAAADPGAAAPAPPPLRDDCFALPPGVDWTPVDAALETLRAGLSCVCEPETVALDRADGRILAADAVARRAHPPVANAAVDGYAFAHAAMGDGALTLAQGRAAAGAAHPGAAAGEAVRILTGAPIPAGCDTVVMDEDVTVDGATLRFQPRLKPGANVRPAGENLAAGAVAAPAGRRLTPGDLAQIAAGGLGALCVRRPLRVGVLSTGDEIAAPGADADAAMVFDSNGAMLRAMIARLGHSPVDLGVAPDDADAVRAALDEGAARADAILTSGGASAGDEDHMSRILRAEGRLSVWRIAMKPGRPLAMGLWRGRPVFGLPGNPVAAFVCALIFARPALAVMAGAPWPAPAPIAAPAAFAKRKKAGRREWLRARRRADGAVEIFHSEGSGLIGGLAWADGLVELPDAAVEIAPGDPVAYHPFALLGL
jgi:molybdopterin molybdotransferase